MTVSGIGGDQQRQRVFISYAHVSDAHVEMVRRLWSALRGYGVDARLDLAATSKRLDWTEWMLAELRAADFVVVVASAAYRRRADGEAPEGGRGVLFEGAVLRDLYYENRPEWVAKVLPVILPGEGIDGIPRFLGPASSTSFPVSEFTLAGLEPLLRVILGQPKYLDPPLGPVPVLAPHTSGASVPATVTPAPAPHAPAARAPSSVVSELGRLADAFGELPEFADASGRRHLLLGLPPVMRNAIDEAPNGRRHIIAILRGCARFGENGRTALLEILAQALPPDEASRRAIDLVRTSRLFSGP